MSIETYTQNVICSLVQIQHLFSEAPDTEVLDSSRRTVSAALCAFARCDHREGILQTTKLAEIIREFVRRDLNLVEQPLFAGSGSVALAFYKALPLVAEAASDCLAIKGSLGEVSAAKAPLQA